ncbi:MAG: hypothetical protein JW973_05935 [Bacteroidales bacterium]|nr:hypothetical protein [Bacteroidales bacterium]
MAQLLMITPKNVHNCNNVFPIIHEENESLQINVETDPPDAPNDSLILFEENPSEKLV